jgi:cellobiose phosphorylase
MGSGDWNDGMNLVGHEGKGESVWLAWFLCENLRLFAALAKRYGDEHFAGLCASHAQELRANIEAHAWDGHWYRRAYFDDDTPLGSASNDECRIDSISQSWAVISGAGSPAHARTSMAAVDKLLVDRSARLVRLLDPPFDHSTLEPGYIKGYLPGVRENGGQYTHAAVWTAMAFAMAGDVEKAWELFQMLTPISHSLDAASADLYKVEPYVMPADIYGSHPHTGRGGWTWYTGAAGWMYRLAVETLLGLTLEVDRLRLQPRVPQSWESFKIHYRYRETTYHLVFKRNAPDAQADEVAARKPARTTKTRAAGASEAPGVQAVSRVVLDGVELQQSADARGTVPLADDHREHRVEVQFG